MASSFELDDTDRGILHHLLANARTTNASIARALDVAESTIASRITKLEAAGIIQGYTARVDREALGVGITALITLDKARHVDADRLEEELCAIPHVHRLLRISGEHFWLGEVHASDRQELARMLNEEVHTLTGVECVAQDIVMSTPKDESVKLPGRSGEDG